MAKTRVIGDETSRELRPALTPEAREKQLIALAYDVVEERLRNGTATSQETTHFLKMGSASEKLKKQLLEMQQKLIDAKIEALQTTERVEELYANAIKAMSEYRGEAGEE